MIYICKNTCTNLTISSEYFVAKVLGKLKKICHNPKQK